MVDNLGANPQLPEGSISLDPNQSPQDGQLNLFPQGNAPSYRPQYTFQKAAQYQLALSDSHQVPIEQLYNDVDNGLTPNWDHVLSQNAALRGAQVKQNFLDSWVKSRDPNATPTNEEMTVVNSLTQDEMNTPELGTILSRRYADLMTNTAMTAPGNVIFQKANQDDPYKTLDVADKTADWVQRANLAQDSYELYQKRYEGESFGTKAVGFGLNLLPGYQWLLNRNNHIDTPNGSLLTGNDVSQQISYLYSLPPDQMKKELTSKLEDLYQANPGAAVTFAQQMISFSRSQRLSGNLTDVADAAMLGAGGLKSLGNRLTRGVAGEAEAGLGRATGPDFTPGGPGRSVVPAEPPIDVPFEVVPPTRTLPVGPTQKLLTGPESSIQELEQAGRSIVSSSVNNPQDISKIAGELGDHGTAAKVEFIQNLQKGDPTGYGSLSLNSADNRMPTSAATLRGFEEVNDLSWNARGKLSEAVLDANNEPIIKNALRVDRLTPNQFEVGATEAFNAVRETFQSLTHNIIDSEKIPASLDPQTNLYKMRVSFGQRDGQLFPSKEAAENFAQRFIDKKTGDYAVTQRGAGGFSVDVTRNVSEADGIRNVNIETGLQTPDTLFNRGLLGSARSPDYQLPQASVNQRGRAVHSLEWFAHQMQEFTEAVQKLGKDERQGLANVLTDNRVNRTWFRNKTDFQVSYLSRNGSMPTDKEWSAYETYVKTHDLDYNVRNNSLITQMSVKGGEFFQFGENAFNGKQVDRIPWELAKKENGQFSIQIVNDRGNKEKELFSAYLMGNSGTTARQLVEQRLAEGYRIVLDPEKAKYFVVKNFRRSQIGGDQLGYNPGGHVVYQYPYFVKQGKLTKSADGAAVRYDGDQALFNAPTLAHAQEAAKLLDEGRRMVAKGDPNAARFFQDKLQGVMTFQQFSRHVSRGEINLDAPILHTMSGERTVSVSDWSKNIPGFYSSVSSPHNIFGDVRAQFMGEQASKILDVVKAEQGVLSKTGIEPLLNPYESMSRMMRSMSDLQYMNDYRIASGNNYAQEFAHLHKDPALVRNNPLYHMANPEWAEGVNPIAKATAERYAARTQELTGFHNQDELETLGAVQTINDWAFNRLGPEGRKAMATPLALIKNPGHYLRAAVFHPTLGLFNPAQFFKQASEATKALAVSPTHGAKSLPSIWLHRVALETDNPQIINAITSKFSWALGMPTEDWTKMVHEMKRSGFAIVGHDVGYLDSLATADPGSGQKFLNTGSIFFRNGELLSRMMAWQVAWREQMQRVGSSNFSRYDLTDILQRTKDITSNMQRDSNSNWQKGAAGITTQWLPYHARMMEQMLDGGLIGNGRKFTAPEKARMMGMNTLLYGIRAPLAMYGIPAGTLIAMYMSANGLNSEDPYQTAWKDGLSGWLYQQLTGRRGDFSGYGPSGLQPLSDLISGDKTLSQILMGAAGGKLGDVLFKTIGSAGYILKDLSDAAEGKGNLTLTGSDLLEPLSEISSVNSARRLWEITNTQNWLSKKGGKLQSDTTLTEGLAAAIAGIQPQAITDAFNNQKAMSNIRQWQREAQGEIRTWMSKSMRAQNDGDIETANAYRQRAVQTYIKSDLPIELYNQAVTQGLTDQAMTSRGSQTYEDFMMRRKLTAPNQNNMQEF